MIVTIIVLVVVGIMTARYIMSFKTKTVDKPLKRNDKNPDNASPKRAVIKSHEEWEIKFKESGLGHHWDQLKPLLRNEILISPNNVTESKIELGQSKIGGHPDLPKNQSWFKEEKGKSLSFLAQINLGEVIQFDKAKQLPHMGVIYFFYTAEQEAWGFDPKDRDKFKVFHFDGNVSELERKDFPDDLPEHARYKTCELKFDHAISSPNWESNDLSFLTDDERDVYIELIEDGSITKLLGYSDNVQGQMEEECQLVTNGIYCGDASGHNDPRAEKLKQDSDNWILLFQIDSLDEAGMMWGDAGRVYFWIESNDLKSKQFGNTWMILQCS